MAVTTSVIPAISDDVLARIDEHVAYRHDGSTGGLLVGRSGFDGVLLTGTQHNDPFRAKGGKVYTPTNRSGGIQGGISNGQTIYFRVAFKPVATVMVEQETVDVNFKNTTLKARGRHDPCVLPRAVPMVEAMTALVLVDHALRHRAQCE